MTGQGERGGTVVVVGLAGAEYAVPMDMVRETLEGVRARPVPGSPSFVEGVINLHGRIVPVVDLRARLGLPGPRLPGAAVLVVTLGRATAGVLVDDVREVMHLHGARRTRGPVAGVGESVTTDDGRRMVLLDLADLLDEEVLAA